MAAAAMYNVTLGKDNQIQFDPSSYVASLQRLIPILGWYMNADSLTGVVSGDTIHFQL